MRWCRHKVESLIRGLHRSVGVHPSLLPVSATWAPERERVGHAGETRSEGSPPCCESVHSSRGKSLLLFVTCPDAFPCGIAAAFRIPLGPAAFRRAKEGQRYRASRRPQRNCTPLETPLC